MKTRMMAVIALLLVSALGCSKEERNYGGSGFVEADEVLVSAEMAGRIITLPADEGAVVAAGDTIAVIDPSRLDLDLVSAERGRASAASNLRTAHLAIKRAKETEAFAKAERDRIQKLVSSGSATSRQLDQLEHEYRQAEIARESAEANVNVIQTQIDKIDADIDRLKRQILDTHPTTPIAGTVIETFVEIGELVSPGKAIVKIAPLDTMWVKVYLSSGDFASVKVGQGAKVSTETGETTYDGQVTWTSAEAEFTPKNVQTEKSRANLVYAVKVRIPNSDGRLKVGMPVYVTLEQS